MFERLANWLNQYDTITINGLEWPLQTRRQKLLAVLQRAGLRVRGVMRHPLFITVVGAVLSWLLVRD